MKNILFLFVLLSFYTAKAQWITRDSLTTARQEAPCVVLDGKIYTAGGIATSLAILKTTEVYDPSSDSWSFAPDMPVPRHHHAMCALNGKIYSIGGYVDLSFTSTDSVYMYDPDSLQWYAKTPLPFASGAGDAVAYNGKIYFIGGKGSAGTLNICLEYDPLADAWIQKTNMPTPREHLCVALSDTLIYAIAGRGTPGADTTLEVYNPANNSWTGAPGLPTARSGCDAAVINGKIFVLGGEGTALFDENEMYDPLNQTWYELDSMPHARHGIGAVAVSDTIYAIGGATSLNYGACKLNEAFLTATIFSSVSPVLQNEMFSVYPNPFNTEVNVAGCRNGNGEHISIYEISGKLLLEKQIAVSTFKIETAKFNSGIYFLKAGSAVKKIVKL